MGRPRKRAEDKAAREARAEARKAQEAARQAEQARREAEEARAAQEARRARELSTWCATVTVPAVPEEPAEATLPEDSPPVPPVPAGKPRRWNQRHEEDLLLIFAEYGDAIGLAAQPYERGTPSAEPSWSKVETAMLSRVRYLARRPESEGGGLVPAAAARMTTIREALATMDAEHQRVLAARYRPSRWHDGERVGGSQETVCSKCQDGWPKDGPVAAKYHERRDGTTWVEHTGCGGEWVTHDPRSPRAKLVTDAERDLRELYGVAVLLFGKRAVETWAALEKRSPKGPAKKEAAASFKAVKRRAQRAVEEAQAAYAQAAPRGGRKMRKADEIAADFLAGVGS